MKEIFLLRHGETEWNRLGLGQDLKSRNDTELNEIGIEQSELTGNYFRDYKLKEGQFDLILCSPLKRTKKTAEIIAKKINIDHNKIIYMNELLERDKELYKKYKYEPNENMRKRINFVIEYIKKINGKKILIVSHGGTIKTMVYMLSGIKPIANYKYSRNCHITYFLYNNNQFQLLYHPNTLHFGIYGKDYINDRNDYIYKRND